MQGADQADESQRIVSSRISLAARVAASTLEYDPVRTRNGVSELPTASPTRT